MWDGRCQPSLVGVTFVTIGGGGNLCIRIRLMAQINVIYFKILKQISVCLQPLQYRIAVKFLCLYANTVSPSIFCVQHSSPASAEWVIAAAPSMEVTNARNDKLSLGVITRKFQISVHINTFFWNVIHYQKLINKLPPPIPLYLSPPESSLCT